MFVILAGLTVKVCRAAWTHATGEYQLRTGQNMSEGGENPQMTPARAGFRVESAEEVISNIA